jgi:predicted AlkP superfamily phosphohydrolase/phosphomutase
LKALCCFFLLVLAAGVAESGPPRVIVVSFDGAGYVLTSRLVAEGHLPNFQRLIREGAWSDGMVTSFPTKTAAAHALLFTGRYGHTSGITGNSLLRVPPTKGSRLETENGYFSTALRVDPVWRIAARAALDTYVLHAPQVYPSSFEPHLFVATGYTEAQSRGEVVEPRTDRPGPDWLLPEARGAESREIRFEVGDESFRGLFFDDPFDPEEGCDTLGVAREGDLGDFVARLKAGADEQFSFPIATRVSGKEAWFQVRLFDLAQDASSFVLYRSGAAEMVVSDGFPGRGRSDLDVYAGNAGTGAYSDGALGRTIPEGGEGLAERRLLETQAHLQSQLVAQARLALAEDYRLVLLYSPVSDEIGHELYGYLDPELDGYDPSLAAKLWPVVAESFGLQDWFLGVILETAARESAHVVVVSDHGQSATSKLVHLNVALSRAGLLELSADSAIDLSRTRALAPPLSDASIAVNTVDRPGGIVGQDEAASVLAEAERALSALVDPGSGERIVTAFYRPSTTGLLQPGGGSTGDLFLDFAPGYYPSSDTDGSDVVERTRPQGNHIFVPTRRDMLAIFAVWGPRIPSGFELGRVRGIDVTPTILELLGVEPMPDLPGRSLVPAVGILN